MTPEEGQTPIKLALAALFDHPELITLDPAQAAHLQQLIVGTQADPHFADVWQYVSTHPLGGDDPWAEQVPVTASVSRWDLSSAFQQTLLAPLSTLLPAARALRPAPAVAPAIPVDDASWNLAPLPTRCGLRVASCAYAANLNRCTVQVQSLLPRHLGAYVEFFVDGAPVEPTSWVSRLPAGAADFLENATVKYVGMVPPGVPVAGMPVPVATTSLTVDLPTTDAAARLLFGGPGLGNLDLLVASAGTLLSFVLDTAVPVIIDGARAGLTTTSWFGELLGDQAVEAEILSAARFLVDGPPLADTVALLQTIGTQLPALLLGGSLPALQTAIGTALGPTAMADAGAVLGWAATELAVQAGDPLAAASASAWLSSPATFSLDLTALAGQLLPDPSHGMWPDPATSVTVAATCAGTEVARTSGPLPAGTDAAVAIMIPAVPAGSRVSVTAEVTDAAGAVWGTAPPTWVPVPAADADPPPRDLEITERPVTLGPSTRWVHRCKLAFDPATRSHRWLDAPAPTEVGLVPAPGAAFRSLLQLNVQDASGDLGYAWQSGDQAAAYAFGTVGVLQPQARAAFSGPIFSQPAVLAYAPSGPDVYLDPTTYPTDGQYHLRPVALGSPMSFDLHQQTSWGAFPADPDRVLIHPDGWAVGCFTGRGLVASIRLPPTARPLDQAPQATMIMGPGSAIGSVAGPTALAVTSTGVMLVLEQGNSRVQAVDPYGNPVGWFAGGTPALDLSPPDGRDTVLLDLAVGPDDALIVLSAMGRNPRAADYSVALYQTDGTPLSRTPGVAAARLAVDRWGRLYTLDFEALSGSGGGLEPTISQWIPASG
jgi:hypothetical protein